MIDPSARRRLVALGVLGVGTSCLDLLGIILLVPLLAYLGGGDLASDAVSQSVASLLSALAPQQAAFVLALIAVAVFMVKGALSVSLLWAQTGVLNRAQVRLSARILTGFAKAPWLVQQEFTSGGMIRTVSVAVLATAQTLGAAATACSELAVFVAVVVALVIVDPLIAGALLAYLLLAATLYLRVIRAPIVRRGAQAQEQAEQMNAALLEVVRGSREIAVRGSTAAYVDRFLAASGRYLNASRLINVSNQGTRYMLEVLMVLGTAAVIGFVLLVSSSTEQVLVSLGVLLAGGFRLIPALNALLVAVNAVRTNEPGIRIVEGELRVLGVNGGGCGDQTPETDEASDVRLGGGFSFRDVTFRYPTRLDPAVDHVTFTVPEGASFGLVGASGSGKSTLVDLLLGLLEPEAGSIEVDGRPLAGNLAAWRRSIGFVPQDVFVADASLAANVALSGTEGDWERVRRAVTFAQLDDVVDLLPHGIDTVLGEHGVRLSGGQRQRIGLARALYNEPSLLILDEATSALDNDTEKRVSEALHSLSGQLTIFVIAHRLSTVRECDAIVFLQGGSVAAIGRFDELCETNPAFAEQVRLGRLGIS
jgi:ABC-type multidrug transport system fused ATPase/permease subunit